MALNSGRIAAAFRALADAFEEDQPAPAEVAPTPAPAKRGRGRPVQGEAAPATAVQAAPAVVEADPFAVTAPAEVAPVATLAEVRAALTALKDATSQKAAVELLKAVSGADNLSSLPPAKYGEVVAAAKKAMPAAAPVAEPDDPFAVPATTSERTYTLEDVRAAVLEATKRTGQDRAAKVVMDLGGKAPKADGSGFGPSWTALPKEQYAAAIAGLNALPSTK